MTKLDIEIGQKEAFNCFSIEHVNYLKNLSF